MYLKRIIAQGFKSFADNTVIDLDNNITGVVGPNGSGKSNVVDAVRWVLGEQSVKSLRGDSMTDVIFSGSKSRSAMNSANVTLIFDNSDNYLNIAFDEVSIKRRLYKDGTNEFYLNGEKCRLKDISDLLVDSGIAKESFNIISQGKIDDILSSKPENRRIIFEEAAGVLKYKKRKEEALRKLDRTHDNMNRVNDIIKELEVQVEPLREQKIKAEEYSSLVESLRELEISLTAKDITEINYKYQENKNEIEKLNQEIISINTYTASNEAQISVYKSKISDLDLKIKSSQSNLLEMISNVEKINSKKQIILERKKYEVKDSKLHERLIDLKESELNMNNNIKSINNEIANNKQILNNIKGDIDSVESDIIRLNSHKNDLLLKLSKTIKDINVLNAKIDTLKDNINNNSLLPFSARSVLENPKLRGIHNVVGSLIEVDEKYSIALSIALGSNVSNIVVDNEECAKEAINYLKNNKLGRATFFPLNIIKEKYIDKDTLDIINKENNYIGILSSLVKYDNNYSNIIKNLLGNVIVVSNIDTANSISKKINYKYRVVTLDGEILHVGGSLTGGVSKTRNIITDKYELEKSLKEQEKLLNNQKSIEDDINKFDYDLKALDDKLYLLNKDKISKEENINIKLEIIKDTTDKLELNNLEISNINSTLNNNIDKEEENIIKEYYDAIANKEKIESDIKLLNNNRDKLFNEQEEFEHTVKKDNSLYNEKNNTLKTLEIEVNRADVKLDNLLQFLNETYAITYEKAVSMYKLDEDSSTARNKISSLKKRIKDLGEVNVLATTEYEKVSSRYEFLIHQQEDLSKAETTLLEIINDMDTVMKQEFLKSFKIIQENFSMTFKELFKGGHAELSLTDSNNLLETGVEINACPPGKNLKNINLLSGGEKTFTAISLLFAILKSRPVPFCILDEVEAALDEVNVEAFGEYIRKLKEKTQFMVITHKKKTMEFVDVLYGITMQESGISKLVSVKLEELK